MSYQKLKNRLKSVLSASKLDQLKLVREIFLFFPSCIYDMYRFAKFSATFRVYRSKEKLQAMLIKDFHIIEKGMSLPLPRPGYGQAVVNRTILRIERYTASYGSDSISVSAINALLQYRNFNWQHGVALSKIDAKISELADSFHGVAEKRGGVLLLSRAEISLPGNQGFSELARTRYSIRDFDDLPADTTLLERAAEIAAKTPSVCNRQSSRIYIFSGEQKSAILALQNGNRGFGERASHVAIIVSDLHCFTGAGERNQPFVDGGLMAMSYVYALHSLGLGTCFLNWSVTSNVDQQLRRVINIPASHVVITCLAIGNIPQKLSVAESPRRSVADFFRIV
ncbi:nitroreductase family protein [Variovorax sp. GB1R11]|uniref:nitroreductase family protein n=1 Tax=Variovorax sp. GB1R11 TaxID=3443741 RepID=UPI003F44AA7A